MHTPNQSPIYLIALGAFALGMASYVTAGLIPMIEASFAVSVAVAAQLVTAFTLAYGLGSPIFVALTPAHRQRAGLLLALGLFVIANAASALAESFTVLMVWRAIAGIGAGVYLAMGIGASAAVSNPERRGKAIAIIMGGMASGVVLGVPLSLLIAEQLGWQAALHSAMGSITSQVLRAAVSGSTNSDTARISMMAKVSTGPLMRSTRGPIRKLPSTPPMPQTHR